MEPKYIVTYVRDKKRNPIGCIVATDAGMLGACYVNKADRKRVSKRDMTMVAKERALNSTKRFERTEIVEKLIFEDEYDRRLLRTWTIPHCMLGDVEYMLDRSYRYFK